MPSTRELTTPADARHSFVRDNALSLACFGLFVVFLFGQSLSGWRAFDADAVTHGERAISYMHYLRTGHFFEATFENWESEFLQMAAFVLLTVFLVQKGSAESKDIEDDPRDEDPSEHRGDPEAPWPVRRGGIWAKLYENSLLAAFVVLFGASIAGHAWSGAHAYSAEQQAHGEPAVTTAGFIRTSQFWFESFQNWQSEFLAVGSIAVLTIFLRQKGSAESKPVHAPSDQTGES